MNGMLTAHTPVKHRPFVVEMVGPAGAGKTTLVEALSQRDQSIVAGVRLHKIGYVPFFLANTLVRLPTYLRRYRHSRWFNREETRCMVYLKAWHNRLSRPVHNHDTVVVLDHGPIFRLVLLREFGPEITKSQVYERWWDSALNQWAATLDMIIWLDAPNPVLANRVNARGRWHLVKGKPELEAYTFLARYRRSYEQVISMVTACDGPRVLRFDTDRASLDQIVDQVLAALDAEPNDS